jgi:hypothetical protein
MSDAPKSDPAPASEIAEPVTTTPAERPVVSDPVVVPESEVTAVPVERPVAVERKKRGVGAWSFVLGLLTGLGDIAFVIWVVVVLAGAVGDLQTGNLSAISTTINAAGLVIVALFIFFGGFVTAGLAALLGLIALVTGRGRVLGVLGLLLGLGALALRIGLLSLGFDPQLG